MEQKGITSRIEYSNFKRVEGRYFNVRFVHVRRFVTGIEVAIGSAAAISKVAISNAHSNCQMPVFFLAPTQPLDQSFPSLNFRDPIPSLRLL